MANQSSVRAIAEIVLNVHDMDLMKQFYIAVMGFQLYSESCHENSYQAEEGDPTIVFLTIGPLAEPFGKQHPQLLVLIDYQRHKSARERFVGHRVNESTLNHLAFQIESGDYESEFDRLSGLGLDPMKTEFPNMSAKAIFFSDPEGNLLEFICHNGQ